MNAYDMIMAPLEAALLGNIRSSVIPRARGDVLEVGIGTGANCPYYDTTKVHSLTGLDKAYDPAIEQRRCGKFNFAEGSLEAMPFASEKFDSVVAALVLCTADPEKSLQEILRVLKPGGLFVFIEHIRPQSTRAGKVFDWLNKSWPRMAHGCNLNRQTDQLLVQSGLTDLQIEYAAGRVFCFGSGLKSV